MSNSKTNTDEEVDIVGRVLGGEYRIDRKLGSGGMSHVYLAHQLSVERRVVVKVMIPPSVDVDRWKGRFLREARAASNIRHRGVVTIFSFGEEDGVGPYIAMEHVEGQSVREVIERSAPLEEGRAAAIVAQACRALHAAHESGVVHRDLKPDNLMVQKEDGRELTRVLDFGVAKAPDALVDTLDGHVVGTPAYMAPEQARNQEVDARADVYSMGIILFELLTGHRPFEAPTAVALMLKHVQEPLPLDGLDDVGPELVAALEKACAKSPDERWESAAAFAEELESIEVPLHTPRELGAVDTDDVEERPVTPPSTTIPAEHPDTAEAASVTSGSLRTYSDGENSARLALGVSIGSLAFVVVVAAVLVFWIIQDGDEETPPEVPANDGVAIELLDVGVPSESDDSIELAIGRARWLISEERRYAKGVADARSMGSDEQPERPPREQREVEFELVNDPTKKNREVLDPFAESK